MQMKRVCGYPTKEATQWRHEFQDGGAREI